MIGPGRRCHPHRAVLLDLVERGDRGPATPAALEHLDACRACEREVVGVALTVAALRRAGAAYRRLPEPAPVQLAVATPARTSASGSRLAWCLQLGSLVAGAAIAAAVVLPQGGMPARPVSVASPDPVTPARSPGVNPWQAAEHRLASSPDTGPVAVFAAAAGTLPPRYPDTLFRPSKEVTASDASARGLEPR